MPKLGTRAEPRQARVGREAAEEVAMMDVVSLGLTVVFFALSVALVALCDRL